MEVSIVGSLLQGWVSEWEREETGLRNHTGVSHGLTLTLNPGDVYVLLTKCIHLHTLFCMNTIIAAQTIPYNFLCRFNTKIVEARTCGKVFHCVS